MTSVFGGGKTLNVSGTLVPQTFIPAAGQTVFNITAFSYIVNTNSLIVFVNGQKQRSSVDYNETSSTSFTMTSALTADDVVEVIGFPQLTLTLVAPTPGTVTPAALSTGGPSWTTAGVLSAARAVFSGNAQTTPVAVAFNATAMALDCTLSNVFTTTLTGNVTIAPAINNPQDGQTINWFLTQDGTGTRTMTWPSSFRWPSGATRTLSSPANSVDLLVATYRSATGLWYASLSKGFVA